MKQSSDRRAKRGERKFEGTAFRALTIYPHFFRIQIQVRVFAFFDFLQICSLQFLISSIELKIIEFLFILIHF